MLIVDDHAFVRLGIKAILQRDPSFEVVGEAEGGQEALKHCRELRPDLILMDVSRRKMNVIEATRAIKAQFPSTRVLVLSVYADHRLLMDAVQAGAAGYLLETGRIDHVLGAVRAALERETPPEQGEVMQLPRGLTGANGTREKPPTESSAEPLKSILSSQETEVLRLIALGKTNRQIAQELRVSLSTVKTYVQRIIRKLEVSDRTQAAVRAGELGLLPERGGDR